MTTKYNIGDQILFTGTIKKIEIVENDRTLYYLKEWDCIPFGEDHLTAQSIMATELQGTKSEE